MQRRCPHVWRRQNQSRPDSARHRCHALDNAQAHAPPSHGAACHQSSRARLLPGAAPRPARSGASTRPLYDDCYRRRRSSPKPMRALPRPKTSPISSCLPVPIMLRAESLKNAALSRGRVVKLLPSACFCTRQSGGIGIRGPQRKGRPEGRPEGCDPNGSPVAYACSERTEISPSPRERMAAMAAMEAAAVVKYGILS